VEKEIQRIIDLGVTLKLNTAIGKNVALDALKKEFRAVYVAIGAQGNSALGVEGEKNGNMINGLTFSGASGTGRSRSLVER